MNYSLIKKSISKLPDDVDEAPFKIINSFNFLYSYDYEKIIKCINIKTGKINFILKNDSLAMPYFGLVNELKLIVKPNESKVTLYQINNCLTECKKIKDLDIKRFQIARSLSDNGYIIGCEYKILIYNSIDELQLSLDTKFNFWGLDFHIAPPFELRIKNNEKNNLLIFPINDTNIYLRKNFKKVMSIDSIINDAIDMNDGNIILESDDKLILVNINNYKIEFEVECPQIKEELEISFPHVFYDIFEFKNNLFITISGFHNQNGHNYLLSIWNYDSNKSNIIENVQCLKFDEYFFMLDKENLLIIDDDSSIIQLNIKEKKGKAKNGIEITTISEFNKKNKKKKIK